jgi:hypothetical protein
MGSRPIYDADREVIDACRSRYGIEVTARQLERWRPFLLDRDVEHVKGMRGSRTVNPPGYVEQVTAIADIVQKGIPLRQVPLVLFDRGLPVKLEVLRAAYSGLVADITRIMDRVIAEGSSGPGDPSDKADILALRMVAHRSRSGIPRKWEERARQALRASQAGDAANTESLFASSLSAFLTGPVTGALASVEGMTEALTVLGYNNGQDPEHVAEHMATLTFTAIANAIESASMEEWESARADLAEMTRFALLYARIQERTSPERLQLPGLVDLVTDEPVSRAALTAGLLVAANEEGRQNFRAEFARLEALDALLSVLPEKFHQYAYQQAPDGVLRELNPILTSWVERHPSEAKLLFQ